MSRQLVCRRCGEDWELHQEDRSRGITARKVYVSAVCPDWHGLRINGEFHPLKDLLCDLCNEPITGEVVLAITIIPADREIGPWENEYGTVLEPDVVATYDALKGKAHDRR